METKAKKIIDTSWITIFCFDVVQCFNQDKCSSYLLSLMSSLQGKPTFICSSFLMPTAHYPCPTYHTEQQHSTVLPPL